MKEFDKIYIAKYKDIDSVYDMSISFGMPIMKIIKTIREMQESGLDEVYKNIPDIEWEKLEGKSDDYIYKKYIGKSKIQNKKAWAELINTFRSEKHNFIEYDPFKAEVKRRMNMIIVNEEWKQIPGFDYSISNYGRVRNEKSKKLITTRFDKWLIRAVLIKDKKKYHINVCRVEAGLFIRKLKDNERVVHKDGDSRNNYYKNLKIVSK